MDDGPMYRIEVCSDSIRSVVITSSRAPFEEFVDNWRNGVLKVIEISGVADSPDRSPFTIAVLADSLTRVTIDRY